jgi:hypothetical protein
MEMGRRKIGEIVAAVGVVLGFIALFTTAVQTKYTGGVVVKYSDDGTVELVGIVILGLAACCLVASFLGAANLDLVAAVAGAAAFGFLLFQPAVFAFKNLDMLAAGAWLGVCAVLIPLGAGAAHLWQKRSDTKAAGPNAGTAVAAIGLVLIVIGIWMKFGKGSDITYWNVSSSGHALGLLMLLLAIVSAILIAAGVNSRKAELADVALIVSGVLAGLAVAKGVANAFGAFDQMGAGAWVEMIGGLALLLGLIASRVIKLPELKKSA